MDKEKFRSALESMMNSIEVMEYILKWKQDRYNREYGVLGSVERGQKYAEICHIRSGLEDAKRGLQIAAALEVADDCEAKKLISEMSLILERVNLNKGVLQ